MMLAASPLLVPLAAALVTALLGGLPRLQRAVGLLGALGLLVCAAVLVARCAAGDVPQVRFGSWPAPYAIEFRVDRLGAVLVLVTALTGTAALLFQESDVDAAPRAPGLVPLLHGVLAGASGAFATSDLFNLYVWFELLLLCTVGLLALRGTRRALEATFKYLVLNLLATALLLAGVALAYGVSGQLAFSGLAAARASGVPVMDAALGVLLVALLFKSAAFPFSAWLPASYPTLPAPVLALCGALLTKVGVYAILRLAGDVLAPAPAAFSSALGWIACATMLVGVLGAMYHWDVRRLLAFHAVSQNGYLLLGIALATTAGAAATVFYTAHYVLVKANLFLLAGLLRARTGEYDLRRMGGLFRARPLLAVTFLLTALSLVGIPPLSGFWAKLLLVSATFAAERHAWAAVALGVSLLTLYSMVKIWMEAFWKPGPEGALAAAPERPALAHAAVGMLALASLALGLFPGPLAALAAAAASGLGGGGTP